MGKGIIQSYTFSQDPFRITKIILIIGTAYLNWAKHLKKSDGSRVLCHDIIHWPELCYYWTKCGRFQLSNIPVSAQMHSTQQVTIKHYCICISDELYPHGMQVKWGNLHRRSNRVRGNCSFVLNFSSPWLWFCTSNSLFYHLPSEMLLWTHILRWVFGGLTSNKGP